MQAARLKSKPSEYAPLIERFLGDAEKVILGKRRELKLTLCTILSGGHLLIEDMPGMGKTTLVKLFAKLLGLQSSRIQFTNDLLPSDILGVSILDTEKRTFHFQKGPIFAELVLADELNRATPKTQSACLQAMEERQVSVDGITHPLPRPFFLIATQNPRQTVGTFPLPESQLDRFLLRIRMGYPDREAEKQLLLGRSRQELIQELEPIMDPAAILKMQTEVRTVHASEAVVAYLQDVMSMGRRQYSGLSMRASLGLLHAAKAWAFLAGRAFVIPEDIQEIAGPVLSHRLSNRTEELGEGDNERIRSIIQSVPVR